MAASYRVRVDLHQTAFVAKAIWFGSDAKGCGSMMWRVLLTLPALIAAVMVHDKLGPIVTVVSVVLIIGLAIVAFGWTVRRDI